jgi:hypothetical protein
MKIIDPNTHTMTLQSQVWAGLILALLPLFSGILIVTHPTATPEGIRAFSVSSYVPVIAWIGWHGYLTPKAQMRFGSILALLSLFTGILIATRPMATLHRLQAYSAFISVPFMAWMAWRGYQRRPKTGHPAKSETFAAKGHPTRE